MKVLAPSLLLVILSGCGGAQTRVVALKTAATEYATCMRWGRVECAAAHVPDRLRAAFIAQKRRAQAEIQLHEYEIKAVDHTPGSEQARIVVLAEWSRPADPVIHQELLAQDWRWLENRWQMTEQRPVPVEAQAGPPIKPGDAL